MVVCVRHAVAVRARQLARREISSTLMHSPANPCGIVTTVNRCVVKRLPIQFYK